VFEPDGASLAGVHVLEIGGGVAGAYCAKLFADNINNQEPEPPLRKHLA
jgi:hypothetical protein